MSKIKKPTFPRVLLWLILVAGLVLLFVGLYGLMPRSGPPPSSPSVEPVPVEPPSSLEEPVYDEAYLADKLYITTQREAYQTGQLVLKIPRMGVNSPIQDGTTDADMNIAPGLYDYSPLPSTGNYNTSIVAHRDIGHSEFYFAHKLGPGDLFYLIYNETIFVYQYETTYVVEADDWGPIYSQGYPCLTLTTCEPIGSTRQRLVVHARLTETLPYEKGYDYKPWIDGIEKPYTWERGAVSWNKLNEPESSRDSSQAAVSSGSPEGSMPGETYESSGSTEASESSQADTSQGDSSATSEPTP